MIQELDGHMDIAGASLEYRLIGPRPDEAPTIVLLHEGLGCTALWKNFPDLLSAQTGFGVFVYSRRGYGKSSYLAPPWPACYMHDEADILSEVLAQLDIHSGFLCGHSDGASIAALCQGFNPRREVQGIVLMAPHFFTESVSLDAIRQIVTDYHRGELRNRLHIYHGDNVDNAFKGWSEAWLADNFVNWNIESVLPHITVPVLVLQGRQDPYGTIAQTQTVERNAGGLVSVVMIDDCNHAPHIEQTEQTLREIEYFLNVCLPN
jgi:pimeloyl-ACP methyl ester carboxylesterase